MGPMISADSHITEPPDTYTDRIDPTSATEPPHGPTTTSAGDLFVIPGM